jgi:hypothetical protein
VARKQWLIELESEGLPISPQYFGAYEEDEGGMWWTTDPSCALAFEDMTTAESYAIDEGIEPYRITKYPRGPE